MDLRWHKVALSVQKEAVSLHVDCNSVETKPLEPRADISTDGHTLLGIRASDAGPVQVWVYGLMKQNEIFQFEVFKLDKYVECGCSSMVIEELNNQANAFI